MKYLIVPFVCLSLLSCQEDEVTPGVDPFVGSWQLVNSDLNLTVSFDVSQEGDALTFNNINIKYPEITGTLDYEVETYWRFPVNTGFKEISIFGSGSEEWIILDMIHNRIHLEEQNLLKVYTMEIHMANREMIVLQDQVFARISL